MTCIYSKVCERYPNCPEDKGDKFQDWSCWKPKGYEEKKTVKESEDVALTKTLLNHVNCKVIAIPSIMKFLSICADVDTFERCIHAWKMWFSSIQTSRESLQIIVECKDKAEYDGGLALFDVAKASLQMTEPKKMLEVELPEQILGRIAEFIANERKKM